MDKIVSSRTSYNDCADNILAGWLCVSSTEEPNNKLYYWAYCQADFSIYCFGNGRDERPRIIPLFKAKLNEKNASERETSTEFTLICDENIYVVTHQNTYYLDFWFSAIQYRIKLAAASTPTKMIKSLASLMLFRGTTLMSNNKDESPQSRYFEFKYNINKLECYESEGKVKDVIDSVDLKQCAIICDNLVGPDACCLELNSMAVTWYLFFSTHPQLAFWLESLKVISSGNLWSDKIMNPGELSDLLECSCMIYPVETLINPSVAIGTDNNNHISKCRRHVCVKCCRLETQIMRETKHHNDLRRKISKESEKKKISSVDDDIAENIYCEAYENSLKENKKLECNVEKLQVNISTIHKSIETISEQIIKADAEKSGRDTGVVYENISLEYRNTELGKNVSQSREEILRLRNIVDKLENRSRWHIQHYNKMRRAIQDSEAFCAADLVDNASCISDVIGYSESPDVHNLSDKDAYGFFISDEVVIPERLLHAKFQPEATNDLTFIKRWKEFMKDKSNVTNLTEISKRSRFGVPIEYRTVVWSELILSSLPQRERLRLNEDFDKYWKTAKHDDKYVYDRKMIDTDVTRTAPNNVHFQTHNSDGTKQLRNILLAFAHNKNNIGYCQGMNKMAAVLLLNNIPSHVVFHWLIRLVESRPVCYFSGKLIGVQVDQTILQELIVNRLPEVGKLFKTHGFKISMFSFTWFMTMFADGFPWQIYMKIFDAYNAEGDSVLFKYALAVVSYLSKMATAEAATDGVAGITTVYRLAGRLITNHERLTDIAFNEVGDILIEDIKIKRDSLEYQKLQKSTLQPKRKPRFRKASP